ncbi:MAG TPA: response regulator [Planctomycetota bacterium]|nr:response regulator [Planctomycetota bacterium]
MSTSKVLLVDDDPGFLKASALFLEAEGFEVFTAEDGTAGLAAAREHKPDVVVIDVMMRRPDEGFILARALRADPALAAAKLLVVTGAGRHYQMLFEPDELWLPVDKVLEKPASGGELADEIRNLLATRQAAGG